MAAREIQQYTDSQLAREIERTAIKAADVVAQSQLDDEDFATGRRYFWDLRHEEDRRREIRGDSPITAPAWEVSLVPGGRRPQMERVA